MTSRQWITSNNPSCTRYWIIEDSWTPTADMIEWLKGKRDENTYRELLTKWASAGETCSESSYTERKTVLQVPLAVSDALGSMWNDDLCEWWKFLLNVNRFPPFGESRKTKGRKFIRSVWALGSEAWRMRWQDVWLSSVIHQRKASLSILPSGEPFLSALPCSKSPQTSLFLSPCVSPSLSISSSPLAERFLG